MSSPSNSNSEIFSENFPISVSLASINIDSLEIDKDTITLFEEERTKALPRVLMKSLLLMNIFVV